MCKKILLLLLALGLWAGSVTSVVAAPGGPIAILLSDSEAAYWQQVTIFSEEIGLPVRIFNLHGDITHDPGLKEKLFDCRPSLIFALGAKAAYVAKLWTQDSQEIPVLFALVLNWQRYKLLDGSSNIAGIAAEISPGTQFVNMTMLQPAMRRIGLLYSPLSETIFSQARAAADLLDLELVTERIDRPSDFQRAFKRLAGRVDAFWLLNDPVIYTLDNVDWLEDRCLKEKLLCVGQTQNLARMGLALAVNPDADQIGSQVADMARNILLHGQKPQEIGVMDPIGTQLIVNLKTVKHIELPVSPQVLDMATVVIR